MNNYDLEDGFDSTFFDDPVGYECSVQNLIDENEMLKTDLKNANIKLQQFDAFKELVFNHVPMAINEVRLAKTDVADAMDRFRKYIDLLEAYRMDSYKKGYIICQLGGMQFCDSCERFDCHDNQTQR
jgi:hypothetical protein